MVETKFNVGMTWYVTVEYVFAMLFAFILEIVTARTTSLTRSHCIARVALVPSNGFLARWKVGICMLLIDGER